MDRERRCACGCVMERDPNRFSNLPICALHGILVDNSGHPCDLADRMGGAIRSRRFTKAERATSGVREAAKSGGGSFEVVALDLADLASVRACAAELNAAGGSFDLIVANAGVMATPFGKTVDGFETQFGTNHLGHFVLTNRIAPLLRAGGRLVNLASSGHRFSDVDLEDPNFEATSYDPWIAYGRSKTANILFAVAFDRRHRHRGIRATAVHPGGIQTELARHVDPDAIKQRIDQINADLVAEGKPPRLWKTIPQGAATSVWAGVVADDEEIGGRYCENCHVSRIVAEAKISPVAEGVRPYALDPDRAEALWAMSEAMVGERFDTP